MSNIKSVVFCLTFVGLIILNYAAPMIDAAPRVNSFPSLYGEEDDEPTNSVTKKAVVPNQEPKFNSKSQLDDATARFESKRIVPASPANIIKSSLPSVKTLVSSSTPSTTIASPLSKTIISSHPSKTRQLVLTNLDSGSIYDFNSFHQRVSETTPKPKRWSALEDFSEAINRQRSSYRPTDVPPSYSLLEPSDKLIHHGNGASLLVVVVPNPRRPGEYLVQPLAVGIQAQPSGKIGSHFGSTSKVLNQFPSKTRAEIEELLRAGLGGSHNQPVSEYPGPDPTDDDDLHWSSAPSKSYPLPTRQLCESNRVESHMGIYNGTEIKNDKYLCGATLIDTYFAISPASCLSNTRIENLTVQAGEFNLTKQSSDKPDSTRFKIKYIHYHPGYRSSSYRDDIALIEFDHPVTNKASCLQNPRVNLKADYCFAPVRNVTVGVGFDPHGDGEYIENKSIKMIDLPIRLFGREEDCEKETDSDGFYYLNSNLICTNDRAMKKKVESKELEVSGSGIYCDGLLVSMIHSLSNKNNPGNSDSSPGFINLANYRRWINSIISGAYRDEYARRQAYDQQMIDLYSS